MAFGGLKLKDSNKFHSIKPLWLGLVGNENSTVSSPGNSVISQCNKKSFPFIVSWRFTFNASSAFLCFERFYGNERRWNNEITTKLWHLKIIIHPIFHEFSFPGSVKSGAHEHSNNFHLRLHSSETFFSLFAMMERFFRARKISGAKTSNVERSVGIELFK